MTESMVERVGLAAWHGLLDRTADRYILAEAEEKTCR